MATFRVENFEQLIIANNGAINGDEILFISSTYTSTEALTISKSLSFRLGPEVESVTITFSHNFEINGQLNGTTQTWTGPFIFSAGTGSSICNVGNVLSGSISLRMDSCTFTGASGSGFDVEGGSFASNCTLNDCVSSDNGNDGFVAMTGSILNMNRCDSTGNTGEAYRIHNSSTVIANECTASDNTTSAVLLTESSTATFTDCVFIGKAAASGGLIQANSSGSVTFTRCTGTNENNDMISSTGAPSLVFNECDFTNNATSNMVSISGAPDTSFSDCKLIQAADLDDNDMMVTAGSFALRRNVIDASLSTSNPSTAIYLANAVTGLSLEGNVFVSPKPTGGSAIYMVNIPNGTTATTSVVHNTFVKNATGGTAHGLSLNGDKSVRGNIFAGFTTAIVAGGTSDYVNNISSAYNVFYNNTNDITGSVLQPNDHDITYDPFLDSTNRDFRLALDTIADELDPSAAVQIDYHQASVVVRGQGLYSMSISPEIGDMDAGPTDSGAYNNANILPVITLTASPQSGWIFGRWEGETISTDNPFVFALTSSQVITVYFFSDITPHLTSPKGGEIFNTGKVDILWNTNNPSALNAQSLLSYEIEYTDNYVGVNSTNWHSAKRRIPWNQSNYEWIVGKMIKSDNVRIRLRSRHHDGSFSDWSMASGDFAINVFKMVPPAIVSPLPYHVYTDFILIILDESLTINTFSQKVRYTIEYSSDKRNVDWTIIVKDTPVGQNVIRWDLEDVAASDDYVLRLTAKNASTSCVQTAEPTPDQISRRFVYNIKIQQPGMFLIDTKPPQAILDIESSSGITSELTQTLTIFAEDETSDVKQIQLRECNASQQLALGDTTGEEFGITDCTPIETLLEGNNIDFDTIIGKPQGYTAKTQWIFEDTSGLRRLEAMLTDSGGNNSLQSLQSVFVPAFRSGDDAINDIIVVQENRNVHERDEDPSGTVTVTTREDVRFEVAYIGTQGGKYWVLEPFPRLAFELDREIRLLIEYFDVVYLFTYVNTQRISDTGSIYRDDKTQLTNIFDFDQNNLRTPNSVSIFRDVIYIGLENGELWSFNGVTSTLINQFPNPVTTLVGDNLFLYIGQANSSAFVLYNGTEFFNSDLEP